MATPGAHGAPMGAPSPPVVVRRNFEKFTKIGISPFVGSKMGQKKVEIEGVVLDLSGELRAEILHPGARRTSQTVGWRPIW